MIPEKYIRVTRTAAGTSSYRMHMHPCWEMLYYTKNTGCLRLEGYPSIPFREGTVICVPPYVAHGSSSDGIFENICVQILTFPEELSSAAAAQISTQGCILFPETDIDLLHLFQMIFRHHMTDPDPKLVDHLLLCVYDLLIQQCRSTVPVNFQVEKLKNAILEQFTFPDYRITDSLPELRCSPTYIRNAFRTQTDMTPVQYLRSLRLKHAASLLHSSDTSLSIADIAYQSGFTDPLYFSKCFRQMYQMSPQAYRDYHNTKPTIIKSEELI